MKSDLAPSAQPDPAPQPAGVTPMPWTEWRRNTPARIALGRAGVAIPTDESLRFGLAHAMARDAIHTPLDSQALQARLIEAGHAVLRVRSQATDRTEYLRRPDLGRRLHPADAQALSEQAAPTHPDVCVVVGDGLSSLAVQRHALPLLKALLPRLDAGLRLSPVVLVQQARVAVADEVGQALGARLSVMLIGERPGLSSPDSLGIYLTHAPCLGRHDAQRNCISNVRPEGLSYEQAAHKLAWLIQHALQRGLSGVGLKDESDTQPLMPGATAPESLVIDPTPSEPTDPFQENP